MVFVESRQGYEYMIQSVPIKIVATVLSTAAATSLATRVFDFTWDENFIAAVHVFEDFLSVALRPVEWLANPLLEFFHRFGLSLELHSQWRSIFVLLLLFNGSSVRQELRPRALDARAVVQGAWIGLASLIGSISCGLVSLENPAVLWLGVASIFLNTFGLEILGLWISFWFWRIYFWRNTLLTFSSAIVSVGLAMKRVTLPGDPALTFWWPLAAWLSLPEMPRYIDGVHKENWPKTALAFAAIFLALGFLPTPVLLTLSTLQSPGLAELVAFILFATLADYTSWLFIYCWSHWRAQSGPLSRERFVRVTRKMLASATGIDGRFWLVFFIFTWTTSILFIAHAFS